MEFEIEYWCKSVWYNAGIRAQLGGDRCIYSYKISNNGESEYSLLLNQTGKRKWF
jgi:hypothetical protein